MILYLVCEDELSEFIMQKISKEIWKDDELLFITIGKRGKGYIKKRINEFNNTHNHLPFFVLVDLDTEKCAPQLISSWIKKTIRPNSLFRIAIKEVESWLLADTKGISKYLNLNRDFIKKEVNIVDKLPDPKEKLIALVDRSKKNELKKDIVRIEAHHYKQGAGYNSRLIDFVKKYWDMERARNKSGSLDRTLRALQEFKKKIS